MENLRLRGNDEGEERISGNKDYWEGRIIERSLLLLETGFSYKLEEF